MALPTARLAVVSDYNRGLAAPIRWVHVGAAAISRTMRPPLRWVTEESRRHWALPLTIGLAAFLLGPVLFGGRLDLWLARLLRSDVIGGDIRRELETFQQWGAFGSIVVAVVIIWQVDPRRRRRLLDWLAALLVLVPMVTVMKLVIGRPRPRAGLLDASGVRIEFPGELLWPWGAWPLEGKGVRHAWEFWAGISSDLWSMPSSHTAYAMAMSVFIGLVYPRLRGLAIVMVVIVGVARVVLGAHYPSDVVVGGCLGYAIAWPAVRGRWGQRAARRLFGRSRGRRREPRREGD